jgi:lantibiotic modifying enzyme
MKVKSSLRIASISSCVNVINSALDSIAAPNDSFFNGNAGRLYYYYNSYLLTGDKSFLFKTINVLEEILPRLKNGKANLTGTSLTSGLTGIAYVLCYMTETGFEQLETGTALNDLDEQLYINACEQIEADYIDYLHGACGIINYFALRKDNQEIFEDLITRLCDKKIIMGTGAWWCNSFNEGRTSINLSLSHGCAGVLLVLLNAHSKILDKEITSKAIGQGMGFILKHYDVNEDGDNHSVFPFTIDKESKNLFSNNRLAWCYGDLNQVLLLYRAGLILNEPYWIKLSNIIGSKTLIRTDERATCISDSHFCHGSSGLTQFYKVLYQLSNERRYLDGYKFWLTETVNLFNSDLKKGTYAGKEHSLLNGLLGIGLTLTSAIHNKKNISWGAPLLLE